MEWSTQLSFVLLTLATGPYAHAVEPTSGESASSSGKGIATENGQGAHLNVGDKAADVTDKDAQRPEPEDKGYGGVSLFATVLYHASVSNINFYSASLFGLGGGLAMQL